ncbi:MAG TPA: hemerythrin domain-containing protein [Bryobacteraceae bacterium]|nr:hemerythrin domain-containing protein [Bryobacteraceae bacterium]
MPMEPSGPATRLLREEHRTLESWLDQIARIQRDWLADPLPVLRVTVEEAWVLIRAHYAIEEAVFFSALRAHFGELVEKMEDQHERVRELAGHLEALLRVPEPSVREFQDLRRLTREFQSVAQHNILEEERDLFRLADRLLPAAEQQDLHQQMWERHSAEGLFGVRAARL